jgi:hypothetical protein
MRWGRQWRRVVERMRMVLLSLERSTIPTAIASLTFRSHDTVRDSGSYLSLKRALFS